MLASQHSANLIFLLSVFLSEVDEGPGGEGEGAKQVEGESRWTPEQQPSCLR